MSGISVTIWVTMNIYEPAFERIDVPVIFLQETVHIADSSFQKAGKIDGDVLVLFQYCNGTFQQRIADVAHDELYIGMTDSRLVQCKGMTVF